MLYGYTSVIVRVPDVIILFSRFRCHDLRSVHALGVELSRGNVPPPLPLLVCVRGPICRIMHSPWVTSVTFPLLVQVISNATETNRDRNEEQTEGNTGTPLSQRAIGKRRQL